MIPWQGLFTKINFCIIGNLISASLGQDHLKLRRPNSQQPILHYQLKINIINVNFENVKHGNWFSKPPNLNSTFRKQNQKDLLIQFFTKSLKIFKNYQENWHFIFKTPKISLMKDLMNKKICTFNSLQNLWKSSRNYKENQHFHLQNSKHLSSGGFNEWIW